MLDGRFPQKHGEKRRITRRYFQDVVSIVPQQRLPRRPLRHEDGQAVGLLRIGAPVGSGGEYRPTSAKAFKRGKRSGIGEEKVDISRPGERKKFIVVRDCHRDWNFSPGAHEIVE